VTDYPEVLLHIGGTWRGAAEGHTLPVINPATEARIGSVPRAGIVDLESALAAARKGFEVWRNVAPFERYRIMRRAAENLRTAADRTAAILTMEQGKPLAEAKGEVLNSAIIIDWFAEEGRRDYGRINPARAAGVYEVVVREPVGPVAAFSPWNFPVNQAVLKISAAVAAGCSVILKGPEETPASCSALVRAYEEAGVPPGVVNLVFGTPSEISEYLIPHPTIRKVSFTGSTKVGKHLAMLAGQHMKRVTMELGGHAPAIVFDDADLDAAVNVLCSTKFHNAGQVCVSPSRLLVHKRIYKSFVDRFVAAAKEVKVGDGSAKETQMGPLAHPRRLDAMEHLIGDATSKGAKIRTGGKRIAGKGYFFEPTVLTDVPRTADVMREEPFGPVVMIAPFETFDEAVLEANRLPYGLASYAYTSSQKTAQAVARSLESGLVSINHHGIEGMPEMPFGGVKDSGYGSEGGLEGIQPYLVTKFITQKIIS
jgi:succinate-semialdehyde dehydrogenase/glutarate-semialdehyde dehydrogenase